MKIVLFLSLLHLSGLTLGLLLRKRIPLVFFGISGLLWGSVFYIVGLLLTLVAGIPLVEITCWLLPVLMIAGMLAVQYLRREPSISQNEWRTIAISILVFLAFNGIFSQFVLVGLSPDSTAMLMSSRAILYDGISDLIISMFVTYGPMVQILHSVSAFLGVDYLSSYAPCFALSAFATLGYLAFIHGSDGLSIKKVSIYGLIMAALISAPMMLFQFWYLHTNMIAAMYLMLVVACSLNAVREENSAWFALVIVAYAGLFFARLEAFVYATVWIGMFLSRYPIPRRWQSALSGFFMAAALWYAYCYLRGASSRIISSDLLLAMTLALAGAAVFFMLLRLPLVQKYFLPELRFWMIWGVIAATLLFFLWRPDHMQTSLVVMLRQMFVQDWWGATWWAILPASVYILRRPGRGRLVVVYGITTLGVILALSFFRNVYHIGWGDSANRMMTNLPGLWVLALGETLRERTVLHNKKDTAS